MLGTNCIRNDELVPSQVSSYDIVYAHGVPENHLEHLWSYNNIIPTRCQMKNPLAR